MNIPQKSYKEVIAANLKYLMGFYKISRKKLCEDLDLKYTSFCDWINAKTYPKFETLQLMGQYFHIEVRDFLIEIESNTALVAKLSAYAKGVSEDILDKEHGSFTVADFDELPEGYSVELINGLFYMYGSTSAIHQRIVSELTVEISMYIRKKKGKCKVHRYPKLDY